MQSLFPARLEEFLINLETLGLSGQYDAVANECLETGGTYLVTGPDRETGTLHELFLHGVVAHGEDEDITIRNWRNHARAALRAATHDTGLCPFPTPRNHFEEIANARVTGHCAQVHQ